MHEFSWNYHSNQNINQWSRSIRCFAINIFWIHQRIDRQIRERKRWVLRFRTEQRSELIKKLFYDRFPPLQKLSCCFADTVSISILGPRTGPLQFRLNFKRKFLLDSNRTFMFEIQTAKILRKIPRRANKNVRHITIRP